MRNRVLYTLPLAALVVFGATSLTTSAALSMPATCPAADTSKSAAYQSGFNSGCDKGLRLEEHVTDAAGNRRVKDSNDYCAGSQAPFPYRGSDSISGNQQWSSGCFDGFTAGDQAYGQNADSWPTAARPNPYNACTSLQGYTQLTNAQWAADYLYTCVLSYRKAINNPRLADQSDISVFQDFNFVSHDASCTSAYGGGSVNNSNGCRAGYSKATDDYEAAFPALPAPSSSENAASQKISHCNLATTPTGHNTNGKIRGCAAGFNAGFSGAQNAAQNLSYDARSIKQRDHYQGYVAGYNAGYAIGTTQKGKCTSQGRTDFPGVTCVRVSGGQGGIVPECNPALEPSDPEGCGIPKFVELIQKIIRYLMWVAIPLAVLALGWGGFNIMTAAGSAGKVEEGISIIKIAITGIVIMLVSYLVIWLVFKALGVTTQFSQGIF